MITATNSWMLVFDNLSYLPPWISDAFCRLATGGALATRELYSDQEEVLLDAQRPVLLNGIAELAVRPDLLDRALLLYLPSIPEERRFSEADFKRGFEVARPRILGALLYVVSTAFRGIARVQLPTLPRMADFVTWVTAGETALGCSSGAFLRAYVANREAAEGLSMEASPVAVAMQEEFGVETLEWQGTANALLGKLSLRADFDTRHERTWPKTPQALSNALRRLTPTLRAQGIEVGFARAPGGERRRLITIRRVAEPNVPIVPSVPEEFERIEDPPAEPEPRDNRDDGDDVAREWEEGLL